MGIKLLKKILYVFSERPTVFLSYVRQSYLFYQTHIFFKLFLRKRNNIKIANNVRFQSIKNLLIESKASFSVGENSIIYENARIEALNEGKISIGKNSIIGDARITSRKNIQIGDRFLTSWNVFISDFDAHPVDPELRSNQMDQMVTNFYPQFSLKDSKKTFEWEFTSSEVTIGINVWVGANVTILKGARIGDNCIIATGSVVTKGDYPANSIIAGNPAKFVKSIKN